MFALVIHFQHSTIKMKNRISPTDIINFELIMSAHCYNKTLSRITVDTDNPIAMLIYDVWYDEGIK